MNREDFQDERALRAWAVERAIEAVRDLTPNHSPHPDFIAVAQRIASYVKGDNDARANGRKRT